MIASARAPDSRSPTAKAASAAQAVAMVHTWPSWYAVGSDAISRLERVRHPQGVARSGPPGACDGRPRGAGLDQPSAYGEEGVRTDLRDRALSRRSES